MSFSSHYNETCLLQMPHSENDGFHLKEWHRTAIQKAAIDYISITKHSQ